MVPIDCVRVMSKRIGTKKIDRLYRVKYSTGTIKEYKMENLPWSVSKWLDAEIEKGNQCILKEETVILIGYKFKEDKL